MTRALLLALGLAGCDAPAAGWRLAGVYDATNAPASGDATFTWVEPPALSATCGPSWMPLGLNLADAVAISARLTPTLAVLLERSDTGAGPLLRDDVRVRLGEGDAARLLEPAVLPQPLAISVQGDAEPWEKDKVRQQIATSLCLEHKLGRAWVGGTADQVNQALLLNARSGASDPSLFFIGFGAPVPALLGPEDACLDDGSAAPAPRPAGLDTNAALMPGDIWNAGLPSCQSDGAMRSPAAAVAPLHLGAVALDTTPSAAWATLTVTVTETTVPGAPQTTAQLVGANPQTSATPVSITAADLVGALPRAYPTFHDVNAAGTATRPGGDTYAVLLIPAWQLLGPDPKADPGDPVGTVLAQPSSLSIAVASGDGTWRELNPYRINPSLESLRWGYPVGDAVAEDPIGGISPDAIPSTSSAQAYRAAAEAGVAAAILVLAGLCFFARARVSDLWTRPPELRLERWIDRPPDDEAAP